jgi:hypothetical protein
MMTSAMVLLLTCKMQAYNALIVRSPPGAGVSPGLYVPTERSDKYPELLV